MRQLCLDIVESFTVPPSKGMHHPNSLEPLPFGEEAFYVYTEPSFQ